MIIACTVIMDRVTMAHLTVELPILYPLKFPLKQLIRYIFVSSFIQKIRTVPYNTKGIVFEVKHNLIHNLMIILD